MTRSTLEEVLTDLGSHFLVGLAGTSLSEHEAELISRINPVGVILFRNNLEATTDWILALKRLLEDVRTVSPRKHLLVSIDHEGGRVHRFRDAVEPVVTHFPAAFNWRDSARQTSRAMGRELRALGFNASYDPVADVWSEPRNTVIGDRAFGHSVADVVPRALACSEGLHSTGVLSCVKHFPGHGATLADSHFELPKYEADFETFQQRDLAAFVEVLASKPPLVMTAHVLYPDLDPNLPASLSPKITRELLRDSLGYNGAVITDDLEMKALASYSPAEIATLALAAGNDILLVARADGETPLDRALTMFDAVAAKAGKDEDFAQQLAESQQRVAELVATAKSYWDTAPDVDLTVLHCEDHQQLNFSLRQ